MVCYDIFGDCWVIIVWRLLDCCWVNEFCFCLYLDFVFLDCDFGDFFIIIGWVLFYEGDMIEEEIVWIEK